VFDIIHQKWTISDELKKGPGVGLFAWIADRIEEFLAGQCHHERPEGEFPLGMTFSFPCNQQDINVGKLINWTKGTATGPRTFHFRDAIRTQFSVGLPTMADHSLTGRYLFVFIFVRLEQVSGVRM